MECKGGFRLFHRNYEAGVIIFQVLDALLENIQFILPCGGGRGYCRGCRRKDTLGQVLGRLRGIGIFFYLNLRPYALEIVSALFERLIVRDYTSDLVGLNSFFNQQIHSYLYLKKFFYGEAVFCHSMDGFNNNTAVTILYRKYTRG